MQCHNSDWKNNLNIRRPISQSLEATSSSVRGSETRDIQVTQEEKSVSSEVIIWAILSKKVYMCPTPSSFQDKAISLYRRATRNVLTRVEKCIEVDGGIFENVLY
jgi:hypothetical protein